MLWMGIKKIVFQYALLSGGLEHVVVLSNSAMSVVLCP